MIESNNVTSSFPLPLFETKELGVQIGKTGERFKILAGLSKELVAQLVEKSLATSDVEIYNKTSDPQRFGTGSYEEWYSKNRTPFALVHSSGALAAIAWYGPKPLGRKSLRHLTAEELEHEHEGNEGDWHTIVYRSYPPFRGTGLMKEFVRFTIDAYKKSYPGIRLWAGINSENPASTGFATSLGFVIDSEHSNPDEHHTVMVDSQN